MIHDYFILAIRNIRKRRLRSWLTMLGIVISIATIFVLISISIGLQSAVEEQFRMLGADKFFIMPKGQLGAPGTGGAVELNLKDVEVVEKVSGIKSVSYFLVGNAEIEHDKIKRYTMAIGIPMKNDKIFEEVQNYKIDEGRMLKDKDLDKIVVGSQYKYNDFLKKNVKTGDKLNINGKSFEVIGIFQSLGNPGDDRQIYMNIEDARKLFNSPERVDQIFVQIDSGGDMKQIVERVDKKLRSMRGVTEKTKDFEIMTPEELLSSFGTILNILTAFLSGIAAISLLVGGIGIMNTMYTSVLERTKEIGIMKAVGARNKDVLVLFLIEAGLLGLIGGLVGVALGYGAAKLIEAIVTQQLATNLLRAAAPWYLIAGCLAFAFFAGAISGVWPAWRASKIKVVDALRYE
jgi:putative ABC transport system permease protein